MKYTAKGVAAYGFGVLMGVFSSTVYCQAQTLSSTGSADSENFASFHDPATWTPNTTISCLLNSYSLDIMGSSDGGPHYIVSDCENFNIEGNITLNVGTFSYLRFTQNVNFSGTGGGKIVIENGATVEIGNNLVISGSGEIIIQPGGILIVNGSALISGRITIQADGLAQIKQNLVFSGTPTLVFDGVVQVGGDVIKDTNNKNITFTTSYEFNDFQANGGALPPRLQIAGTGCEYWGGPYGSCSDSNIILPVELLDFTGKNDGESVELSWTTASELNNDYFTLERSADGINFEFIGKVSGNGTVHRASVYKYVDRRPLPGIAFYRLYQTDFDGKAEMISVISVRWVPQGSRLSIYPNPVSEGRILVEAEGMAAQVAASLQIVDAAGRAVYRERIDVGSGGYLREELDLGSTLRRGMYVLEIQQSGHSIRTRLMVL